MFPSWLSQWWVVFCCTWGGGDKDASVLFPDLLTAGRGAGEGVTGCLRCRDPGWVLPECGHSVQPVGQADTGSSPVFPMWDSAGLRRLLGPLLPRVCAPALQREQIHTRARCGDGPSRHAQRGGSHCSHSWRAHVLGRSGRGWGLSVPGLRSLQTGGFAAEVCSLLVLEAGGPRPGCQQGWFPLRPCSPGHVDGHLLPVSPRALPCVCLRANHLFA